MRHPVATTLDARKCSDGCPHPSGDRRVPGAWQLRLYLRSGCRAQVSAAQPQTGETPFSTQGVAFASVGRPSGCLERDSYDYNSKLDCQAQVSAAQPQTGETPVSTFVSATPMKLSRLGKATGLDLSPNRRERDSASHIAIFVHSFPRCALGDRKTLAARCSVSLGF